MLEQARRPNTFRSSPVPLALTLRDCSLCFKMASIHSVLVAVFAGVVLAEVAPVSSNSSRTCATIESSISNTSTVSYPEIRKYHPEYRGWGASHAKYLHA